MRYCNGQWSWAMKPWWFRDGKMSLGPCIKMIGGRCCPGRLLVNGGTHGGPHDARHHHSQPTCLGKRVYWRFRCLNEKNVGIVLVLTACFCATARLRSNPMLRWLCLFVCKKKVSVTSAAHCAASFLHPIWASHHFKIWGTQSIVRREHLQPVTA